MLVHGIIGTGGSATSATGIACNSSTMWGTTVNYLTHSHPILGGGSTTWQGSVLTIGFYRGATGCSYNLYDLYSNPHQASCDNAGPVALVSPATRGTTDEDIGAIACRLAWFIYDNYSSYGANVDLIGHSMGGPLIRYMMVQVAAQNTFFPPYVYVQDAVTFDGPIGGTQAGGEYVTCAALCWQGQELDPSSQAGRTFYSQLKSNLNPQGAGPGTDWTAMGSYCGCDPFDVWNVMYQNYGHRLAYGISMGYEHGTFLVDSQDYYNASQYYCDGCVESNHSFPHTYGAPHSLHNALFAFLYHDW
jgi:putative serine esterase DUF676